MSRTSPFYYTGLWDSTLPNTHRDVGPKSCPSGKGATDPRISDKVNLPPLPTLVFSTHPSRRLPINNGPNDGPFWFLGTINGSRRLSCV